MPSEAEINDQLYKAAASKDGGMWTTRWPGTTFEQGVHAALSWVRGDGEPPMDPQ